MKHTMLLSTLFLFSRLAFGLPGESMLTVSSAYNRSVQVIIDGNRFPVTGNGTLMTGIAPGFRRIEVYGRQPGFRNQTGSSPRLLYSENVWVRPRHQLDLLVNRFGKVYLDQQPDGYSLFPDEEMQLPGLGFCNTNLPVAMQDADFRQLVQTLRREAFEDTRLQLAGSVLSSGWFTTVQVGQMMQVFHFDDNRLELARMAYPRVTDKNRFYTLTEALTFNKNRESLLEMMR